MRASIVALLAVLGALALAPSAVSGASRAASPSCAIPDQVAPEGDAGVRQVELKAVCATALEQDLVYSIQTADGTAGAGDDYEAVDTTATASAGALVLRFPVPVLGDTLHEGDETFTVTLADPSGATTFSRPTATITILDNEEPEPVCTIPDPSFEEGDSGNVLHNFAITCDRRLPRDMSFRIRTADGTATAGDDYFAIDGPGSIVAGQTTLNAAVFILGDGLDEPDETFTYSLTDNAGLVTFNTGTITIVDDDEPSSGPCILLSDTEVSVSGAVSTPTTRRFAGPVPRLTVTNCGSSDVNLNARGTDATGSSGTWELTNASSGGAIDSLCELGTDLFRADLTLWWNDGGGTGTPLTTEDTTVVAQDGSTPFVLASAAEHEFSPSVELPCEGSVGLDEPMTTEITLTAIAP